MVSSYKYTPAIWPSVFTALVLIALAAYNGRRRSVPGALSFTIACLFAELWAAGSVIEYAAADMAAKIFWIKFQAAWQLPVATAVTCFVLEYTWPGRWLTRRNLALLSFPGLLSIAMILTDGIHHLSWNNFSLIHGSIKPQFGPGIWFLLFYSFGVLQLVNLVVFGSEVVSTTQGRGRRILRMSPIQLAVLAALALCLVCILVAGFVHVIPAFS